MHSWAAALKVAESMSLFFVVDTECGSPACCQGLDRRFVQEVVLGRIRCTAVVVAVHMMVLCHIDRRVVAAGFAVQRFRGSNFQRLLVQLAHS